MGSKDTITRKYMSDNGRFADLFNNALFEGRRVIIPDELTERDPTELAILPAARNSREKSTS